LEACQALDYEPRPAVSTKKTVRAKNA
jgi:hypothetical protein